VVEPSGLVFGFWACASGVILAAAAISAASLRNRDRYVSEVLSLLDIAKDGESSVEARAEAVCRECREKTAAGGVALYTNSESAMKKMLQAGDSAEVTGPGVVRDLLMQAINSGTVAEAVQGGRFLMSMPVSSSGGAALLLFWEDEQRPDEMQRSLLEITVRLLSFLLPGLENQSEISRLHEQVNDLKANAQTEMRDLAAELGEEHHLASVGRLAAGVAHELNTPLGAVLTMVSSLLRKEEDANKSKRLTIVKDAVEKCRDIITKLMVYSRSPVQTETGLTFSRFVRTETDLNAVISGIGEMMSEELKSESIELVMNLGELPPFRANGSQWSHVFTNLIANARDVLKEHKPARARITVSTAMQNGKVLATVADNGPGVPESHRAKIFEPFFTTKEVGRGTGLGLAICREIIRKHKGDIAIKDAPGGGALFEITIDPQVEAEPVAARLPKEQYP
jgi:signal transduction histidine kinase